MTSPRCLPWSQWKQKITDYHFFVEFSLYEKIEVWSKVILVFLVLEMLNRLSDLRGLKTSSPRKNPKICSTFCDIFEHLLAYVAETQCSSTSSYFFEEIPRKTLFGNRSLKKVKNFKSLVLVSIRSSNKALSTRILGFSVVLLSPGSF